MRKLEALLAVLIALGVPRFALAKKPIQVLTVQSEDAALQAQALALTEALKAAIGRTRSFELAAGDYSLEVMSLALGCPEPPDAACLVAIGDKIQASAFVWGTLRRDGERVSAQLHLWQRSGGEGSGGGTELALGAELREGSDPALRELAYTAFARLIRGEKAGPSPGAAAPRNTETKPAAELPSAPKSASSTDSAPAASSNSGIAWGAIGLGAVLLGGGVYSVTRVHQINDSPEYVGYRSSFRKDQNVCLEAEKGTRISGQVGPAEIEDLCSQARTFEALQYVLFGLGSAAIGTGILILLTDRPEQPARAEQALLRLAPQLGPRRGGVVLELDF